MKATHVAIIALGGLAAFLWLGRRKEEPQAAPPSVTNIFQEDPQDAWERFAGGLGHGVGEGIGGLFGAIGSGINRAIG